MRKTLTFLSIIAIIVMAGCGKSRDERTMEKAIEKETEGKADVDLARGTVNIETENGNVKMTSGDSVKLPRDFPKDVYTPKNARIMSVMESPEALTVSFSCKDKPSSIASVYRDKMSSGEWTLDQSMDMGSQQILMFSKNKRTATVSISTQNNETFLALVLADTE